MRILSIAVTLALSSGVAHAASTDDGVFANGALRELHNLAVASAKSVRAAKDSDELACRDACENIQKAAHEALTNMHSMSFAPIDSIGDVSGLLRVSQMAPDRCTDEAVTSMGTLPMVAGQAVISLRYDYAIGDGDWYMADAKGEVEAKNPLRYAQSLKDQNYSWVSVRPKGMLFMAVSDWKAEMASREVDDPSIENSGNSLKAVEVDYRKNSDDSNTMVYFFRTKDDALAAAQAAKQQAGDEAKSDADIKASNAEWGKRFLSLPYMAADRNPGFKLVYAACRSTGKNGTCENTCSNDGSHDWSASLPSPAVVWPCAGSTISQTCKGPYSMKPFRNVEVSGETI